jgi:hypothetical protein
LLTAVCPSVTDKATFSCRFHPQLIIYPTMDHFPHSMDHFPHQNYGRLIPQPKEAPKSSCVQHPSDPTSPGFFLSRPALHLQLRFCSSELAASVDCPRNCLLALPPESSCSHSPPRVLTRIALTLPPSASSSVLCRPSLRTRPELLCVIAVTRHGERTPKQKMKCKTTQPGLLDLFSRQVVVRYGSVGYDS